MIKSHSQYYFTGCRVEGIVKGPMPVVEKIYTCADENDGFYPSGRTTIMNGESFHVAFNSLSDGRQFLRDCADIRRAVGVRCGVRHF